MECESKENDITINSDNMMVEVCSFEYKKKRKNPFSDLDKAKFKPYVINNTLKNIIHARQQKNK
jgi:hypothetical protein